MDQNTKLHHTNIIISQKDCRRFVFEILEKSLSFEAKANPDFLSVEKESFGIDDARDLIKWAVGKPLLGQIKISLTITKSITNEAQNALLKVFEEPPFGTYFFICLESKGGLLPTLLSRINFLDYDFSEKKENKNNAIKFLQTDTKGKLSLVQSLSKKTDKTDMKEMIKDLEEISYEYFSKDISKAEIMKNILTAKIFATVRGSSPRMLLEWLSCVV